MKIKEVKGCKPWSGPNGTVYYYALVMDNGDKIELGKKTENAFTAGMDIDYEIKGEGKGGWKKAKQVQERRFGGREPFEERAATMAIAFSKDLICAGKLDIKHLEAAADRIYNWMQKHK